MDRGALGADRDATGRGTRPRALRGRAAAPPARRPAPPGAGAAPLPAPAAPALQLLLRGRPRLALLAAPAASTIAFAASAGTNAGSTVNGARERRAASSAARPPSDRAAARRGRAGRRRPGRAPSSSSAAQPRRALGDRRPHRLLREPRERHGLAARADRARASARASSATRTITAYGGGSSRSLSSASAASSFISVRAEDEVDAPVGLERAHVQVAAELADRVDPDLVAERLEHVEVGVRAAQRRGRARRGARRRTPIAAARLPTPAGPWKRYACAGPSSSAARRSRLASACSGTFANVLHDLLRDVVDGTRAVDGDDPLREEAGELAVALVDEAQERRRPPARSGRARAAERFRASSTSTSSRNVTVGKQPADRLDVEARARARRRARARCPGRRATSRGSGRRRRPTPSAERRPDDLVDELRPRCREERRLRPGPHLVPVEEQLADPLAKRRAARLARRDDGPAVALEGLPEQLGLGRLARSVDTFERDEHQREDSARSGRKSRSPWSTRSQHTSSCGHGARRRSSRAPSPRSSSS